MLLLLATVPYCGYDMKLIQMIITELDHLVAELPGRKLRTLFVAHWDFCCPSLGTTIPRQLELAGKASFVASPPWVSEKANQFIMTNVNS